MEPVTARRQGVTPVELREAERGLSLMLARKFSATWIAEHARDLLAQANIEYAEWLEENPPARNPVGWLLTCAYRRALNLLDSQNRKPQAAPLEAVFHLADESTPTPEEQVLDNDRQSRLREALGHLPEKERLLLAMVYFEGSSIREAGRRLGWQKSAADRHHSAAMEKMLVLVGDRSLLSPANVGVASWVISKGEGRRAWTPPLEAAAGSLREGLASGLEAITASGHRLADVWRRVMPFSEPGGAAASGGAGRVLGYCGAAAGAVVCGLAATGSIGPGVGIGEGGQAVPAKVRKVRPARQVSAAVPTVRERRSEASDKSSSGGPKAPTSQSQSSHSEAGSARQFAPQASTKKTIEEFGVDRGEAEPTEPAPSTESSGESSSSSSSANPTPAPAPPPGDAATRETGL